MSQPTIPDSDSDRPMTVAEARMFAAALRRLHRIVKTLETRISSHERLCAERSAEDAGRAKADAEARERLRNVFAGVSALIGLVALFLSLSR